MWYTMICLSTSTMPGCFVSWSSCKHMHCSELVQIRCKQLQHVMQLCQLKPVSRMIATVNPQLAQSGHRLFNFQHLVVPFACRTCRHKAHIVYWASDIGMSIYIYKLLVHDLPDDIDNTLMNLYTRPRQDCACRNAMLEPKCEVVANMG